MSLGLALSDQRGSDLRIERASALDFRGLESIELTKYLNRVVNLVLGMPFCIRTYPTL